MACYKYSSNHPTEEKFLVIAMSDKAFRCMLLLTYLSYYFRLARSYFFIRLLLFVYCMRMLDKVTTTALYYSISDYYGVRTFFILNEYIDS